MLVRTDSLNPLHRAALISVLGLTMAQADLVSWWSLEGTPGDAVGINAGYWNGTPTYSSSVLAPGSTQAGSFSGSASPKRFVRMPSDLGFDSGSAFSASAWIKASPQDSTILGDMRHGGSYRGWELHVGTTANGGSSAGLTVWLIDTYPSKAIQVSSSVTVLDDTWHHVGFSYDGSGTAAGVRIYVDGALAGSSVRLDSLGGTIANGSGAELNIGSRQGGAGHTFTGLIDEVAVFDHELDGPEMSELFSSGVDPTPQPPGLASTAPLDSAVVPALTSALVEFTRAVSGVGASDLLVNGVPASEVEVLSAERFRFTFPQPADGPVAFTWAPGHGIVGSDNGLAFPDTGWSATLDPDATGPAVFISEFLALNSGGLEDEDHASPDWIEITNAEPTPIDLAGWTLTDDATSLSKWTFPSTVLEAGGRAVIFASGKDRAGTNLHTNFKLSRDGGYLALHRPSGGAAHVIDGYPRQEANISFGPLPGSLLADGEDGWRYFPAPTPGTANPASNLPATAVRGVAHSPSWPGDSDAITVTAQIQAVPGTVSAATLFYRVGHGGEIALPMVDGPTGYVAVIPAAATSPGQMVRWRIEVTAGGVPSRWPLNTSSSVALPRYLGTTIRDSSVVTQLPLYEVFVSGYAKPPGAAGPYHAADSDAGTRGAFAWQGVLYDNVFFRIKGTTSRYLYKRSHRIDFNPGHGFGWSETEAAQEELNLNSEYVDPSYCRQYLSLWMQRESGTGAAPHFPVRVHMNGGFWQLAFHTMPADRDLLRSMGLDDRGALYKQVGQLRPGSPEKENRNWESHSDYNAFANGINESRSLAQRVASLYDTAELATVINYLAVARLTQEADDVWANMVLYRDSEGSGEWRPVPFDLNLSFGQLFYDGQSWNTVVHAEMDENKSHPLYGSSACRPQYPNNPSYNNRWNRLYDVVIQDPATRAMLLRRMRTLMDHFYGPPGTPYSEREIETELDVLWARIQPEAILDHDAWGRPPRSGPHGLDAVGPAQAIDDVKALYLDPRRNHLYVTHSIDNHSVATGITNVDKAGIPNAQPAAPRIDFGTIEFNPAGGNQDEEYICLVNPNTFAVDVSGWRVDGGVNDTLDPGTVIPPRSTLYLSPDVVAFRNRNTSPTGGEGLFVQGNYDGHLSNFGETLTLTDDAGALIASTTYEGDPTPLQQWLAISELVYAPVPNGAAEFIELVNTSEDLTLDLDGVYFSDGVDFTFTGSAVTSLAPGARVLIVRDLAAFEATYGSGHPVAGSFANGTKLNNGGERLKLEDAGNNTIFDITYAPSFPWPEEGAIVLASPQPGDYPEFAEHWRLSAVPGGTPGTGDTDRFSPGGSAADLTAYATGSDGSPLSISMETLPGETQSSVVISYPRVLGTDDVAIVLELSQDLQNWQASESVALEKIGEQRIGSTNRTTVRYRVDLAAISWSRLMVRLRISVNPP